MLNSIKYNFQKIQELDSICSNLSKKIVSKIKNGMHCFLHAYQYKEYFY